MRVRVKVAVVVRGRVAVGEGELACTPYASHAPAVVYLVGAKQQSRLRDPAILFSRRPTLVSMRQATIHTPDKYTCDYARGDIGSRELPARGA